jgi:Fe-S cluster assembly protein SufD
MTATLPTPRDENWRYANLRPLAKANPEAVPATTGAGAPSLPPAIAGHERWVFRDGRFDASLSQVGGDSCASLLDARGAGTAFTALLDADLAHAGVDFALARINAARGGEVMQIRLADDAPHKGIELVFLVGSPAAQGTSYPRVQVHAGRNARISLVERHLGTGPDELDAAVNAAVDIAVGGGAQVDHVRLQSCPPGASCFDTLVAHVGENARYRLRTITLGGSASRSTLFIKLAGRAAECDLGSAIVANHAQTHDMFAEIEHAAPDTVTRELFRGIANERGKLAFNGKMIVREHAHDSSSDQSLKSLLTGAGAEAAARPQLEIYTNQVRARHGATTGKLDEQMLFYLLSRGIDRPSAQALLQWAFIEDAVSLVGLPGLRRDIEALVAERLRDVSSLDGLLGDRS